MLREREDVAFGVEKPGYFGDSSGGGPDSVFTLLEERIAGELNPFEGHLGHRSVDVVDLPAEDGEGGWREISDASDADHGSVCVHHKGEAVIAYEAQTEGFLVKAACAVCVLARDEGDESVGGEHGGFPFQVAQCSEGHVM